MNIINDKILSFKGVLIDKLPEGFKTELTLDLTDSNIKELPNELYVGGDLIIGNSEVKALPEKLYVEGNLDISNSKYIINIPYFAIIGGYVIDKDKKYYHKTYEKNSLHNHLVCCNDGSRIVFYNWKLCLQRHEDTYLYYSSISGKAGAVKYKDEYFLCEDEESAERLFLRKKRDDRIAGGNYHNISMDKLFNIREFFETYQKITDCCDDAYNEVEEIVLQLNLSLTERYPWRIWVDGAKYSDYRYNYLFLDLYGDKTPNLISLKKKS
jgi:hypothetical protein